MGRIIQKLMWLSFFYTCQKQLNPNAANTNMKCQKLYVLMQEMFYKHTKAEAYLDDFHA